MCRSSLIISQIGEIVISQIGEIACCFSQNSCINLCNFVFVNVVTSCMHDGSFYLDVRDRWFSESLFYGCMYVWLKILLSDHEINVIFESIVMFEYSVTGKFLLFSHLHFLITFADSCGSRRREYCNNH